MSSIDQISALAVALCLLGASLPAEAQEHTLYVGITDGDGNPVTDLTREDVIVRWDGENLQTTGFEAVVWPVRLTVFVDNSRHAARSVEHMRNGLRALLRELPDEMDVALLTTAWQASWITRHTSDRAELERGISVITPDTNAPTRFVDSLIEEAARIDEDEDREYYPVVVIVGSFAVDSSTSQQGQVDRLVERLLDNSVEVHTLLFVRLGALALRSRIFGDHVIEELAPITRGSFELITDRPAFVEKLAALGRDIARKHRVVSSQYRITYRQPRNPSSQPAIDVVTGRQGLDMIPTLDGNVPARMISDPGRQTSRARMPEM